MFANTEDHRASSSSCGAKMSMLHNTFSLPVLSGATKVATQMHDGHMSP